MNKKINNFFIITFIPKQPELFENRKRFSVGAWQLYKYIGLNNAEKLLNKMLNLEGNKETEKYVFKYRTKGTIILYAR